MRPAQQVGSASGVSNMARYVGAAVFTAIAATVYSSVITDKTDAGESHADALAAGLGAASWVMVAFSLAGVAMAVVMGRPGRERHGGRLGRSRSSPHPHPAHLRHVAHPE